jgi:hypothetical protein
MSANIFEVQPHVHRNSVLHIFSVGTLENSHFVQLRLKMQRHFTNALLRRVEPFPTASGPLKFATVHDQTYPWANGLKWRASGTLAVNCDFKKHNNSTVMKWGTCIINMSFVSKIHSAVQMFPDWIFYSFPTNAIYRAAIELRSWNRFSQECKLALV